jgi:hypothetical protein
VFPSLEKKLFSCSCNFLSVLSRPGVLNLFQTWGHIYPYIVALGGVMVNVLAIGSKVRCSNPAEYDGFLRAIKIRSTISFRHVKRTPRVWKRNFVGKIYRPFIRQVSPALLLMRAGNFQRAPVDNWRLIRVSDMGHTVDQKWSRCAPTPQW